MVHLTSILPTVLLLVIPALAGQPCGAGRQWTTVNGVEDCYPCPAGTWGAGGNAACQKCPTGTVNALTGAPTIDRCYRCQINWVANDAQTLCSPKQQPYRPPGRGGNYRREAVLENFRL